MSELADILCREILDQGPVSFARFMEIALYHPELGYYERPASRVGRQGDFFTSVSVGSLFGELLAFQFAQWLEELQRVSSPTISGAGASDASEGRNRNPPSVQRPFQVAEAGAHDGRLALDVLSWFRERRPSLLEKLEYWIIEPSRVRQEWQRQTLAAFAGHVHWFSSWETLPPKRVCGVIFANELLDAFPIHRLGWDANTGRWFEWGVTWQEERFAWAKLPEEKSLRRRQTPWLHWPTLPNELLAALPDGFTTEVSPAAEIWWNCAASALGSGKLLTVDYGMQAEQFFTPERAEGTLCAYHRHQRSDNVLARVGEQDLTAHVNFTAIRKAGEQAGLRTERLVSQSKFLATIAGQIQESPLGFGPWAPARIRQFQTLIHPEHLGRSFQVLVQSRG